MKGFAFRPIIGHPTSQIGEAQRAIAIFAVLTCLNGYRLTFEEGRARLLMALVIVVLMAMVTVAQIRRYRRLTRWRPGAWTVCLVDPGPRKARVRSELAGSLGTDAFRAQGAVNRAPIVVAQAVDETQARVLAARLTFHGARVELAGPPS